MEPKSSGFRFLSYTRFEKVVALSCAMLLTGTTSLRAQLQQEPVNQANAPVAESSKMTSEQLESLVAPIALYPDPLLAQVLAASTYPLEIIQLQQWLAKHTDLKDKALVDAVQREDWEPSVQAMAALPDVVKQLAENIKWTSELGNAFLAQQSEVMDAVQRMRVRAKDGGQLKSTEQMKVETTVVESKSVIVIEQANPEVIYVPSYNPTVVWGASVYPYPPMYYPPAGYYAAGMAISFGVGLAMGAAWGGGWGWGCGWGGNNTININRNNNFNRNTAANIGSGNSWQHNPQHRGGAPYGDRSTADRFGGNARGDSLGSRQSTARQNQGQIGGRQQPGGTSGDRFGGAGGDRGSLGGDRIGNRQTSSGASSRDSGTFGGGRSTSGSSARASSQRGASSMGASRSRSGGGGGRRR